MGIKKLLGYLGGSWSGDEWGDFAGGKACEQLATLGDAGYNKLRRWWTEQPALYQVRLASILSDGKPSWCVPLLVDMLKAKDEETFVAATESLRAIVRRGKPAQVELDADSIHRLERLRLQESPYPRAYYEDLVGELLPKVITRPPASAS